MRPEYPRLKSSQLAHVRVCSAAEETRIAAARRRANTRRVLDAMLDTSLLLLLQCVMDGVRVRWIRMHRASQFIGAGEAWIGQDRKSVV